MVIVYIYRPAGSPHTSRFPRGDGSGGDGLQQIPVYHLRALTKAEGIALPATTVLEYLERQHRYQDVVDVAGVILRANPRDALTMVKRGAAFGHIMQAEFLNKFPSPASIPPSLQSRYRMLADVNRRAFEDAERLGWEPSEQARQ